MVGARGFEPPTSRSRTVRATRLRYAPLSQEIILGQTSGEVNTELNFLFGGDICRQRLFLAPRLYKFKNNRQNENQQRTGRRNFCADGSAAAS